LLMGRQAGERTADGSFPAETVHRLVQDRLREYAEQVREFGYVSHAPALAAGGTEQRSVSGHSRA
jgi:hypothetical protein